MKKEQLNELLFQALETELGGVADLHHRGRMRGQF